MAYSHTLYSALKTILSNRLGDAAKTFWTDTELGIYLTEAFRTFGVLSAFWRDRAAFNTVSGTAFYDLPTQLSTQLGSTVTDRDLILQIQYMLLESTTGGQTSWTGTEQFTYTDIVNALQQRLNQFLSDTGIVVTRSTPAVAAPSNGRVSLADTIIDVRRAAWKTSGNVYSTMWREDERMLTAAGSTWPTSGVPQLYSVIAPPPITLQIVPNGTGTLELITVNTGATLNPASAATALGIPDDLTPAIKWGALADLLGRDGIARDPIRSAYCEAQYQIQVKLAREIGVIVNAVLSTGVNCIPCTLQELESSTPLWENQSGTPVDVATVGQNLIALSPVPNAAVAITLDVIRAAPTYADGAQVQIGREQIDMIVDYAEHLALFKVGGAEWKATNRQAQNFMTQAITYNQRLAGMGRAMAAMAEQSQREPNSVVPRRDVGSALGAVKDSDA